MDDPFYAVKAEVEVNLRAVNQLYEKWQRLQDSQKSNGNGNNGGLSASNTGGWGSGGSSLSSPQNDGDDLRWAADELKEHLMAIEEDLKDLEDTVKMVESNPNRFKLDPREISSRKEFISKTRKSIRDMKSAVNNPGSRPAMTRSHSGVNAGSNQSPADARKNKEKSERDALFASKVKVDSYGRTEEEHRVSNQKFIDREQGVQQQIMRQQDAQLDEVMDTVGNLKEVAVVMNKELDDQTRLLDDLETSVDSTKGKLDMGMKRLKEFVNANADSKQQCTICGLITALVILLILVLWL
ncbi:Syntaxin-6 [Phlyctochytrium planicorne]|nr:Syntaxin-6 [Phlyctochytrium planicorne]